MKFQDDISNLHTHTHTDKPKPICPHFFKVGGINITDFVTIGRANQGDRRF